MFTNCFIHIVICKHSSIFYLLYMAVFIYRLLVLSPKDLTFFLFVLS